jgi:transcriptional regulator with XRE-family HTH domain
MAKRCTRDINDNPLRKLRNLIGTEEKPIPQHELASLTGISVNTIRSIEGGHRDAGRSTLKKIEVMTGATWDPARKEWLCRRVTGEANKLKVGSVTATTAYIQQYIRMMKQTGSAAPDRDRDAVKMRIDALFDHTPARYWMPLLASIQNSLESIQEEFFPVEGKSKGKREVARIFMVSSYNTGMTFTRSYGFDPDGVEVTKYRKRMAEKYAELTNTMRRMWWQELTSSPLNY